MARAFQIRPDGSVSAELDVDERELLAFLIEDALELLHFDLAAEQDADPFDALVAEFQIHPVHGPRDPVSQRLFPDAFSGDDEASAEFRRFTEAQLRTTRARRSRAVLEALRQMTDEFVLSQADAHECVQVLTDLRLVLGTRLGISDERNGDDSGAAHEVYDWLTWLQESLVQVLFMLPPRGGR